MGRWLLMMTCAGAALAATTAVAEEAPMQTASTASMAGLEQATSASTAAAAPVAEIGQTGDVATPHRDDEGFRNRPETTGPLSGIGQSMADKGFRFRIELLNEFAQNPVGGVRQGEDDAGQLRLGGSVDLQKLLGIQGGTFHFGFVRSYGQSLAKDYTGDFAKTQEVYKNLYQQIKGTIFAYEQKAFDDKLDVLVGRLGSTAFYGRLSNTCYFMSGLTCGVPQLLNSETNFTFPTSATWAANVKYHFNEMVSFQTGAYEVDSFDQSTNGYYWPVTHATGVTVPSELQIGDYNLAKSKYPWDVKFGGYVSTAPVVSILYNTKGQLLGQKGGTAEPVDGEMRNGFYVMGEKAVWRGKDPNKSLAVFGGYEQALDKDEIASTQLYTGAVLTGIVPGRPHDIISGTASYMNITSEELDFLHEARVKAGGDGWNKPNQFGLEFDYSILLFKATRLSPNISYIINPDNSSIPNTKVLPQNEFVFGLKLSFSLGRLLGLPESPNLSD
jgi:porin